MPFVTLLRTMCLLFWYNDREIARLQQDCTGRQGGVDMKWIGLESLSHKSVVKGGREVKITFYGNKLVLSKFMGKTINIHFSRKQNGNFLALTYEIMTYGS